MKEVTEEVIQVSDWSQKYKLAIYAVSGILISVIGYKIITLLIEIRDLLKLLVQ